MSRRGLADKADLRALSIGQPYAERILRGIKRIEYRSRPTCQRPPALTSQPWFFFARLTLHAHLFLP
jgi:hypothetical protein